MSDTPAFTLQQLRIFRSIAVSPSLTRAAKDLGITQPSLSQHLAKLEERIGARLFDRRGNQLHLTDAGSYLLERADRLVAEADEIEARMQEFAEGHRGRIAVGVLPSLARSLMPTVMADLAGPYPGLELDIHELAPLDAIEQLYARTLQIAILSANALAENRPSLVQRAICADPYVLAVPASLDLSAVTDPRRDLTPADQAVLRRTIQFEFGTRQNQRIEEVYRKLVPGHEVVARCRTYETAMAMVEAGQGIAIAPQMAVEHRGRRLFAVRLHEVPIGQRPIAAFTASQYLHVPVFRTVLECLARAGGSLRRGELDRPPPFIEAALRRAGVAV